MYVTEKRGNYNAEKRLKNVFSKGVITPFGKTFMNTPYKKALKCFIKRRYDVFVGYYAFLFVSNINDTKRLSYVHTILLKKNLTALPFKKPISPRTSTFLLL